MHMVAWNILILEDQAIDGRLWFWVGGRVVRYKKHSPKPAQTCLKYDQRGPSFEHFLRWKVIATALTILFFFFFYFVAVVAQTPKIF